VLDPQAVVLVAIEARHQGALEVIHDLPLTGLRDARFGKAQHAGGVPLGVLTGIDQRLGLVGVAAQHLSALAVPIPTQEVAHGP